MIPMEKLFVHCFQSKLEFRSVCICGGRKTREPGEKPSEQDKNQQQTQPTYMYDAGLKPMPDWREPSALTAVSFLLPANKQK